MGNTCVSIHIAWRGSLDDAARAVSRSYAKLGYELVKKAPAEGCKHVVLPARQAYVSVYDSENDSDRYEFIVFASGRQKPTPYRGKAQLIESKGNSLRRKRRGQAEGLPHH